MKFVIAVATILVAATPVLADTKQSSMAENLSPAEDLADRILGPSGSGVFGIFLTKTLAVLAIQLEALRSGESPPLWTTAELNDLASQTMKMSRPVIRSSMIERLNALPETRNVSRLDRKFARAATTTLLRCMAYSEPLPRQVPHEWASCKKLADVSATADDRNLVERLAKPMIAISFDPKVQRALGRTNCIAIQELSERYPPNEINTYIPTAAFTAGGIDYPCHEILSGKALIP